MSRSLWLARLLGIGAVLESVLGLGLLIAPGSLASFLLRSSLEGSGIVVARIAGGGLLALGIACWFARNTPAAPAGRGVAWALLAYNAIACVTLASAAFPPVSGGAIVLGVSVLHGVLGLALTGALSARDRGAADP
jgi:hypothetical protein